MMRKIYSVYKKQGVAVLLFKTVRYIYINTILEIYRGHLRSICTKQMVYNYNSVNVPVTVSAFDNYMPLYSDSIAQDNPDYEEEEAQFLRGHCSDGNDVVIVGGGWGVTAVIAAQEVGSSGSVIVYEASKKCYEKICEVININSVEGVVDVRHAVVGDIVSLDWSRGDKYIGNAVTIPPEKLPDGDVYEFDCEGAEKTILESFTKSPEKIVVETHGRHGVSEEDISVLLEEKGYEIIDTVSSGRGVNVISACLSKNTK